MCWEQVIPWITNVSYMNHMPFKTIFMQVALAGTQIFWTTEVNNAFHRLEEGYENALKDYYKKQISQLNALIVLLLGSLSKGDRQKVRAEWKYVYKIF